MQPLMTHDTPVGLVFPLPFRPSESYHEPPRSFGASRRNGRRHAGCDLYAPVGTPVLAMRPGRVIRTVYAFYCSTYALEIDHGKFVARYGEIQRSPARMLGLGDSVRAGQLVGAVGQLDCYSRSMLHLEIYAGGFAGALTQGGIPFFRRPDVVDPAPYLDKAYVAIACNADGTVTRGG